MKKGVNGILIEVIRTMAISGAPVQYIPFHEWGRDDVWELFAACAEWYGDYVESIKDIDDPKAPVIGWVFKRPETWGVTETTVLMHKSKGTIQGRGTNRELKPDYLKVFVDKLTQKVRKTVRRRRELA